MGLLVPLAIHFWNKKKVKTIKIGSIQLLHESNPKQTRELQLNELSLLFLRLILLSVLALILAGAQLRTKPDHEQITYLVEPSLVKSDRMVSVLDTISIGEIKLLQEGFPHYDQGMEIVEEVPNYWELAKNFYQLHTDSIVVFTEGFSRGIKGKRPETSAHISWIQVNSDDQTRRIPILARNTGNQVEITELQSDLEKLDFEKQKFQKEDPELGFNRNRDSVRISGKWLPLVDQGPIRVIFVADEENGDELRFLEATFRTLEKVLERKIELTRGTFREASAPHLWVWLSQEEPPRTQQKILVFQPDPLAKGLLEKGTRRKLFYLVKELNSENIFSEHLAEELLLILDLNAELEKEIKNHDRRTLGPDQLVPEVLTAGIGNHPPQVRELSGILWGLLLLLLILERILSWLRKQ